jgi:hypothetical protein
MKKAKRRKLADMPFDEGLARLIQTKPEEVRPPPGKKRKTSKAAKRLASSDRRKPHQEGEDNRPKH